MIRSVSIRIETFPKPDDQDLFHRIYIVYINVVSTCLHFAIVVNNSTFLLIDNIAQYNGYMDKTLIFIRGLV